MGQDSMGFLDFRGQLQLWMAASLMAVVWLSGCGEPQKPHQLRGPLPNVALPATSEFGQIDIDRYVVEELCGGKDREAWVEEWRAAMMPPDVTRLRVRLNLMVREVDWPERLATIDAMLKHPDLQDDRSTQIWNDTVEFLMSWWEDRLVQTILENRPDVQPYLRKIQPFLDRWETREGLEVVDRWLEDQDLAANQLASAKLLPQQYRLLRTHSPSYWYRVRCEFNLRHSNAQGLIDRAHKEANADAANLQLALDYLHALCVVRESNRNLAAPSVEWFVSGYEPRGIVDLNTVGQALYRGGWAEESIILLQRSLTTPLSDEQYEDILEESARVRAVASRHVLSKSQVEASIRTDAKHALVRAYLANKQPELAQPLVEELSKAESEGVSFSLAQISGRTQAVTGQRVVQQRILDAEEVSEDSPAYWRKRALYFQGRQEWDQADDAHQRIIGLTPRPMGYESDSRVFESRVDVIKRYATFLARQKQTPEEASQLIWDEFHAADRLSPYARAMVELMPAHAPFTVHEQNAELWQWIESQPRWEKAERQLIGRMIRPRRKAGTVTVQRVEDERVAALWPKLIPLAQDADPTRAQVLGEILLGRREYQRAQPLLENAQHRFPYDEAGKRNRASVRRSLYKLYLATGQTARANDIWPEIRASLQPGQVPAALAKLTRIARDAGDTNTAKQWHDERANLAKKYDKPFPPPTGDKK
ncbi:hypothetical protein [Algisphaera agarilytica]|uniref:Tetratricopeptide repeat-containing protein n=1 Tax=Algisphaera agarilytica TaxID=1385975 RepID=A0A7X0H5E4_9BACT|nr:hypothetical protein [Algisphaera agarilytica]MBB6429382.1 hypothetical protein [Algisphaera agarilytica]